MPEKKEDVREIVRKACKNSIGAKKVSTVTMARKHLIEAVGDEKAKELIGARQKGENVAVCPRFVLEAIEGAPKTK